jgi:hypothetical protein
MGLDIKIGEETKKHSERSAFLVEMAGIEPASEEFGTEASTSLVAYLSFAIVAPADWVLTDS